MVTARRIPPFSIPLESDSLSRLIKSLGSGPLPPVILCIGTDRVIGDSLGPLAGSMVSRTAAGRLPVYGTLQRTVHALNLEAIRAEIKKKHPNRLIIAVDASLGPWDSIGTVSLRPGCLYPGAGVRKKIAGIGDISITGIAGEEGCRPYLSLQTARLSTVVFMAEQISRCILDTCLDG